MRSLNRCQKTDPLLGAATCSFFFLHVNNPQSATLTCTSSSAVIPSFQTCSKERKETQRKGF